MRDAFLDIFTSNSVNCAFNFDQTTVADCWSSGNKETLKAFDEFECVFTIAEVKIPFLSMESCGFEEHNSWN